MHFSQNYTFFLFLIISSLNMVFCSDLPQNQNIILVDTIRFTGNLAPDHIARNIFSTNRSFEKDREKLNEKQLEIICDKRLAKRIVSAKYDFNVFKKDAPFSAKMKEMYEKNFVDAFLVHNKNVNFPDHLQGSVIKLQKIIPYNDKNLDLIIFTKNSTKECTIFCMTALDCINQHCIQHLIDSNKENKIVRMVFKKNDFSLNAIDEIIKIENNNFHKMVIQDIWLKTPLHYLIGDNNEALRIEKLLEKGTSPNILDFSLGTPFIKVCRISKKQKIIKILIKQGCWKDVCCQSKDSVLHSVVTDHDIDLLNFYLNEGLNPNIKNKNGSTALHCLCAFNLKKWDNPKKQLNIAYLLLEYGANPNIINKKNESPLSIACQWSKYNLPLIHLLLAKGASVFINKKSILHLINKKRNPELYDIIFDAMIKESGNY